MKRSETRGIEAANGLGDEVEFEEFPDAAFGGGFREGEGIFGGQDKDHIGVVHGGAVLEDLGDERNQSVHFFVIRGSVSGFGGDVHLGFIGPGEARALAFEDGGFAVFVGPDFSDFFNFVEAEVGFGFAFELAAEVAASLAVAAGIEMEGADASAV